MAKKISDAILRNTQVAKKDLAAEIIAQLRLQSPADQNKILETIIKELARDRIDAFISAKEIRSVAEENLDIFMKIQHAGEAAMKEREAMNHKNY